ncbi:hypothetical protein PRO82_001609 [Candidatus Protochlamydia amoebophila]|nr:hypothetical protein [Candidatus Protochlamydia amoebophila]
MLLSNSYSLKQYINLKNTQHMHVRKKNCLMKRLSKISPTNHEFIK